MSAPDDDEVANMARLTSVIADDLERRRYQGAPGVRRAARMLMELAPLAAATGTPRCDGCGAELVQTGRGRPRKWCSESCRRRHRP